MSTETATLPAGIYVRISQDAEDTGLGVARQRADCEALAEAKGWHVAEVFEDNDTSATSGKPRPAYQRMVHEIEAGRIRGIVVWDVDRLTRTPRELEDVISWADRHGLALASVGGEIDLATPQGRMTARIKGTVARHETEQMSRRITRKHQELAEAGRYVGPRPYGWDFTEDRRLVINEAEAAVIREAVKRVLLGESLNSIINDLNERGIPTARGHQWRTPNLRSVLLRPTNCALRTHRGKVTGPGDWPPIISQDEYERVVSLLTDPARLTRVNRGTEVRYLLSGIIQCAECDGPMMGASASTSHSNYRLKDGTVKTSTHNHPERYRCITKGCYKVTRRMEDLDNLVTESVLATLERQGVEILGGDSTAAETARARIDALESKLSIVADQFAEDTITADQFQRITAKLRPQLEAARSELNRAMPAAEGLSKFAGPTARKAWDAADLEQRRRVIRLLLEIGLSIKAGRAGKRGGRTTRAEFDPETIQIRWHGRPEGQ